MCLKVYETLNGALMQLDVSVKRGEGTVCVKCGLPGATLGCFKLRCLNVYHVTCAYKAQAMFFQDKVGFDSLLLYQFCDFLCVY